ncbi:MAG TPA: 50S ribosomal protein L25/general stress protein Ctc [Longimicrobiales bacterium]|nr:50S ribosomal protein L25/general stress protein Ctc [Longimicrobiales bacterium]
MGNNARLQAEPRQESGKSATRKMRAAGRIPAVVYGHGEDTRMLSVDAHELELLFNRVHWENTIVELTIQGERAPVRTLVREVQSHAYKPLVVHVDFQQIHAGERVHVSVPIRLIGNAPGVKEGGVMMQTETDLDIRCTPDRIPESIEVDVSGLGIGDAVHLRDIVLPEGVEAEIDAERTICSVTPPTVSATTETAEEAPAAAGGEPEVIGRPEEE